MNNEKENIQMTKDQLLDKKHIVKSHGKELWAFLHTISVYLPEKLNLEEIRKANSLFKGALYFGTKFDNKWSQNTKDYISEHDINFNGRDDAMMWMCHFHNNINMKLGKDLFLCTKGNITKRWGNSEEISFQESDRVYL